MYKKRFQNLCFLLGFLLPLTANAGFDPASMWAVGATGAGDNRLPNAGYDKAPAESYMIYMAIPEVGGYHHHPIILHHKGTFYAAYSEARNGEDAPGQRIRANVSKDGMNWGESFIALDSIGDYSRDWQETGVYSGPSRWIVVDDRVWLLGHVGERYGYAKKSDREKIVSTVRFSGSEPVRGPIGHLATEVFPDGSIGEQFWVLDKAPESDGITTEKRYPTISDPKYDDIREQFLATVKQKKTSVGPAHRLENTMIAVDGHYMGEHTIYQRPDGKWVQLMRDLNYSHRLYYSESDDGDNFTVPVPTDIPDCPSKTRAGTLPDGRNYIVGNLVHNPDADDYKPRYNRYPLAIALSDDGKIFDRAYTVRSTPTGRRFYTGGSADGYSYPYCIVVGDYLWVIYSVNKQDMAVTRIPWKKL